MYKAKRFLDIVLASCGLVISLPLITAAAFAIRVTMGPPVFFIQRRAGQGGRPLRLVKLRTMVPGHQNKADEERITWLGHVLRLTSVDELPSLWNVLKGDMSLVGPRPLLMKYLDRYTTEQARRHQVKPGITGWAQVNGRNALSWEEKFELDVWYVEHLSFWLDVKILAMTAWKVLRREGISHPGQATMEEFMGSKVDQ